MNTDQIKKQLAEKGTPINDYQAQQLLSRIQVFCDRLNERGIKLDWHYNLQQVGTDSFSIEYCHRETVEANPDSISPLQ